MTKTRLIYASTIIILLSTLLILADSNDNASTVSTRQIDILKKLLRKNDSLKNEISLLSLKQDTIWQQIKDLNKEKEKENSGEYNKKKKKYKSIKKGSVDRDKGENNNTFPNQSKTSFGKPIEKIETKILYRYGKVKMHIFYKRKNNTTRQIKYRDKSIILELFLTHELAKRFLDSSKVLINARKAAIIQSKLVSTSRRKTPYLNLEGLYQIEISTRNNGKLLKKGMNYFTIKIFGTDKLPEENLLADYFIE